MWLDSTVLDRYGKVYLDCTPQQKTEMLDLHRLSQEYRGGREPQPGVEFFSFLRNLTADGFFTSKIGIEYLGYIGNGYLAEFPGCPPVPGV